MLTHCVAHHAARPTLGGTIPSRTALQMQPNNKAPTQYTPHQGKPSISHGQKNAAMPRSCNSSSTECRAATGAGLLHCTVRTHNTQAASCGCVPTCPLQSHSLAVGSLSSSVQGCQPSNIHASTNTTPHHTTPSATSLACSNALPFKAGNSTQLRTPARYSSQPTPNQALTVHCALAAAAQAYTQPHPANTNALHLTAQLLQGT